MLSSELPDDLILEIFTWTTEMWILGRKVSQSLRDRLPGECTDRTKLRRITCSTASMGYFTRTNNYYRQDFIRSSMSQQDPVVYHSVDIYNDLMVFTISVDGPDRRAPLLRIQVQRFIDRISVAMYWVRPDEWRDGYGFETYASWPGCKCIEWLRGYRTPFMPPAHLLSTIFRPCWVFPFPGNK